FFNALHTPPKGPERLKRRLLQLVGRNRPLSIAASRRKVPSPSCLIGTFVQGADPRALAPDSPLPTQLPKATVAFAHHYQCMLELGPGTTD
ncbi:unnamed protein product, partial [Clonostachys rosea]